MGVELELGTLESPGSTEDPGTVCVCVCTVALVSTRHAHTGLLPQRKNVQLFAPNRSCIEWWSGEGAEGGDSADPSLERENPMELIHKQQAGSLGPTRCAAGFNGSHMSLIPN